MQNRIFVVMVLMTLIALVALGLSIPASAGYHEKNPCAAKAMMANPAIARTVWGEVISVDWSASAVSLWVDGQTFTIRWDKRTQIKTVPEMTRKSLADLRSGARVTVSFVEQRGKRRAAFIYYKELSPNYVIERDPNVQTPSSPPSLMPKP